MGIVRAVWELLLPLPDPLRFALVVGGFIILLYQILRRATPLLLWPEFIMTNRMRRWGLKPLPGTYAFGDGVILFLENLRRFAKVAFGLLVAVVVIWSVRPSLEGTAISNYVDRSMDWWYSFETRMLDEDNPTSSHPQPNLNRITSPIDNTNVNDSQGAASSPADTVLPESTEVIKTEASSDYVVYTVKEGDILYNIAIEHGVTINELVALNEEEYPSLATNQRLLTVGWQLRIPKK